MAWDDRPTDDLGLADEIRVLEDMPQGGRVSQALAFLAELQRHRATMKRLEEWAVALEADEEERPGSVGRFVVAQLRICIKGG